MRIVVLYAGICMAMAGCSMLPSGMFDSKEAVKTSVDSIRPVPPPQPIGYTQELHNKEPYTGALPYVLCFGSDCDKPTPKTIARKTPPVRIERVPVPVQIKEVRIKESIGFLFNSIEIDPGSGSFLETLIKGAKSSKEVWIKGYAGLTDTNVEKEKAVISLALARARYVEKRMKSAGVQAHITVGAELVRCASEDDCLKEFKYGGRRTDLEIVILDGEKSGEPN